MGHVKSLLLVLVLTFLSDLLFGDITKDKHLNPQCNLDTYSAGALCDMDVASPGVPSA